jgi:ankyrin repeat protein
MGGGLRYVQNFVNHGADINLPDEKGNLPMHFAAVFGQVAIVRYLLDLGADINHQNGYGETALFWATSRSFFQAEVARLLLDRGADIHLQTNDDGYPVLHGAARRSGRSGAEAAENIQLLLDRGADMNLQDKQGDTPLHHAARIGRLESVRILLDGGAKMNLHNSNVGTPLHVAASDGSSRSSIRPHGVGAC